MGSEKVEENESEKEVKSKKSSSNHNAILEIAKESEILENNLQNTDWDCLDEKQTKNRLRYFAENQYKLIEKLDSIHTENNEERNLRKSTVKIIQKRLNAVDSKLD